jgi:HD-like signal output (HDOD) protein
MRAELDAFIRRIKKLPTLPALYGRLAMVLNKRDASLSEITDILRMDQGLASRLLRLANSAFYGFPSEIGTLEEAVRLLGLRQIQDLTLSTSVIKAFELIPTDSIDATSFWQHSIACGIASALVAEEHQDPMPQRFFVGGLLHDVGRLVLFLNAPNESADILRRCEQKGELSSRVETEVLGFDHELLGAELMAFWNLPLPLREMIRCHHNPADSAAFLRDAFIVHYADFITSLLELGNSGERFVSPLKVPNDCERWLVPNGRLLGLVDELERRCKETFPVLLKPE